MSWYTKNETSPIKIDGKGLIFCAAPTAFGKRMVNEIAEAI
jgi:hypothetical protein